MHNKLTAWKLTVLVTIGIALASTHSTHLYAADLNCQYIGMWLTSFIHQKQMLFVRVS